MTADELESRFSARLRAWMGENGVGVRALAELCGVSPAAPHRWATGKALPRSYELRCLCEATGIGADEFLELR